MLERGDLVAHGLHFGFKLPLLLGHFRHALLLPLPLVLERVGIELFLLFNPRRVQLERARAVLEDGRASATRPVGLR